MADMFRIPTIKKKKEEKPKVIAPAKATFTPLKRAETPKATARVSSTVKAPVFKSVRGGAGQTVTSQADKMKQVAQTQRKTFTPSMQGDKTTNLKSLGRAGIEALQSTAEMGIEMGKSALDPMSTFVKPINFIGRAVMGDKAPQIPTLSGLVKTPDLRQFKPDVGTTHGNVASDLLGMGASMLVPVPGIGKGKAAERILQVAKDTQAADKAAQFVKEGLQIGKEVAPFVPRKPIVDLPIVNKARLLPAPKEMPVVGPRQFVSGPRGVKVEPVKVEIPKGQSANANVNLLYTNDKTPKAKVAKKAWPTPPTTGKTQMSNFDLLDQQLTKRAEINNPSTKTYTSENPLFNEYSPAQQAEIDRLAGLASNGGRTVIVRDYGNGNAYMQVIDSNGAVRGEHTIYPDGKRDLGLKGISGQQEGKTVARLDPVANNAVVAPSAPKVETPKVQTPEVKTNTDQIDLTPPVNEGGATTIDITGEDGIVRTAPQANINTLANDIKMMKPAKLLGVKKWGHMMSTTDIFRIVRDAFPPDTAQRMKKMLLDPFDKSKGKMVDYYKKYADGLKANVVGKGITKNSKASELLMRYGEGKNLDPSDPLYFGEQKLIQELTKKYGSKAPQMLENIKSAEQWMRSSYNQMLDDYNAVMRQIYPKNPEKIVQPLNNYFHHFQDFEKGAWRGVWDSFMNPAEIGGLSGSSAITRPKSKFMDFAQKRLGMKTEYDAVGGFIDYLKDVGVGVNISPEINRLRQFEGELQKAIDETGNKSASQFKGAFSQWLNSVAGKSTNLDRGVMDEATSRAFIRGVRGIQSIFSKNALLFQASTALMQPANMINGMAFTKQHFATAIPKAVRALVDNSSPMRQAMKRSNFLKERFADDLFRQFDTGMAKGIENIGATILGKSDEIGTRTTWMACYDKGVAEGLTGDRLIQYADENTRRLVGGRGIGEVPTFTNSTVGKIVSPFTVEVTNLYHVYGDMVKGKDFAGLILMGVLTTAFNEGTERLTGRRPLPDAVNALWDIYSNDTLSTSQKIGRLPAEGMKALPLGSYIALGYGGLADRSQGLLPAKGEFLGSADPSRYGTGLFAVQTAGDLFNGGATAIKGATEGDIGKVGSGLLDITSRVLPMGGGGQLKKTIQGITTVNEGMGKNSMGEYSYPVAQTKTNYAKGAIFGKNALSETSDYFKLNERINNIRLEQERNTAEKKAAGTDFLPSNTLTKAYTDGQLARVNEIDTRLNEIKADKKLNDVAKKAEIAKLYREKQNLANTIKVRDVSIDKAQDFIAEKSLSDVLLKDYRDEKNIDQKYVADVSKQRMRDNAVAKLKGMTTEEKKAYLKGFGVDYWSKDELKWWDKHPKTYAEYNEAKAGINSVLSANIKLSTKATEEEARKFKIAVKQEATDIATQLYYNSSFDVASMEKKAEFLAAVGADPNPLPDQMQQEDANSYRNTLYDAAKTSIPKNGITGAERAQIKMEMMILSYKLGKAIATDPAKKAIVDKIIASQ